VPHCNTLKHCNVIASDLGLVIAPNARTETRKGVKKKKKEEPVATSFMPLSDSQFHTKQPAAQFRLLPVLSTPPAPVQKQHCGQSQEAARELGRTDAQNAHSCTPLSATSSDSDAYPTDTHYQFSECNNGLSAGRTTFDSR
jgi:hypothetical protein